MQPQQPLQPPPQEEQFFPFFLSFTTEKNASKITARTIIPTDIVPILADNHSSIIKTSLKLKISVSDNLNIYFLGKSVRLLIRSEQHIYYTAYSSNGDNCTNNIPHCESTDCKE